MTTWSLRKRYYAWITALVLVCFALNVGIDASHDLLPESWRREDEPGEELREVLFILGGNLLALPLIIGLGWFAVERMIRPLRNIVDAAAQISSGHIDTRIPYPVARDEIHALVDQLNRAFDRCRELLDQMQRFNSNAAHQLRTPLAALRSQGEVALQRERPPGEYREVIETMLERTAVMTRLVEQLLELAALEDRRDRHAFPVFAPATNIAGVVEDFDAIREHRQIQLKLELHPEVVIRGDPVLLEQVVANMLDNALRFTPTGGAMTVGLRPDGNGYAELWVDDSGPGIPEAERRAVFERFEQCGRPDARHTGLGLAIVAEIARVHGGAAFAQASPEGGARVGVTLPLASAN